MSERKHKSSGKSASSGKHGSSSAAASSSSKKGVTGGSSSSASRKADKDRKHMQQPASPRSGDEDEDAGQRETIILDYEGRRCKLHTAVANDKLDDVSKLIEDGANVDKEDADGATPLHHASYRGLTRIVKALLRAKPKVTIGDLDGTTPLHHACFRGHEEVVEQLIRAGADVNVQDLAGGTPLLNACYGGHAQIVSQLVDKGVKLDTQDRDLSTALHYAAFNGKTKVVQMLVDKGAKLDTRDQDNATPLHHAVYNRHLDVAKILVNKGAKLSAKDIEGGTPLHTAAFRRDEDLVKYLLEKGANPEAHDKEGATALHKAAYIGSVECAALLIENKAGINHKDGMGATPLHKAAYNGHSDVCELLIQKQCRVDILDDEGGSALHNAVYNGQLQTAELLISCGGDANVVDAQKRTPLHGACVYGLYDLTKMLLDKGCNPNAKDKDGISPLHLAAFNGSVLTVVLLLDAGANINIKNDEGVTPVHYAAYRGHVGILELLVSRGAEVRKPDGKGAYPLHNAAANGETEACAYLLFRGASLDEPDSEQYTPLHAAVGAGHVETSLFLIEKGANYGAANKDGDTPEDLGKRGGDPSLQLMFEIIESEPDAIPFSPKNKRRLNLKSQGMKRELEKVVQQLKAGGAAIGNLGAAGGGAGGGRRARKPRKKGEAAFKELGIDFDLNDPVAICEIVEDEAKAMKSENTFINVMRHFLLIPQEEGIGGKVWKILEFFIHRAVVLRDDDDQSPDRIKLGLQDFVKYWKGRNKFDKSAKEYALTGIEEALAILFPGTQQGDEDVVFDLGDSDDESSENSDDDEETKKKKKKKKQLLAVLQGEDPDTGITGEADMGEDAKKKDDLGDDMFNFDTPPPPTIGGGPPPPPPGGGPPPPPPGGGPPPPPGMGPPPPPGMGMPGVDPNRPKMKRLNWTKIPKGKISVTFFNNMNLSDVMIDKNLLEKHFQLKSRDDDGEKKKEKSAAQVNLLDLKRANNVGILLSRIKLPLEGIKKAIVELDEKNLTIDDTKALLVVCPTDDEIETLKNFKGDSKTLGKAEQFFMKIMDIPRLQPRLEAFLFKREFEVRMDETRTDMKGVRNAIMQVRQSSRLQIIMKFVLVIGNFLNAGGFSGGAVGYKFDSILKVQDTKATSNKFTLLHYLAGLLAEKMPEVIELREQMPDVCDGVGEKVGAISGEVNQLKKSLSNVQAEIEQSKGRADDPFHKVMSTFYELGKDQIAKMDELCVQMSTAYDSLATYVGCDKGVDPVSIANGFIRQFEQAHRENVERKAARLAAIEKAKKQKQMKKPKKGKKAAASSKTPKASALLDKQHIQARKKKMAAGDK